MKMKTFLLMMIMILSNGIIVQGQSFVDGNYKFTIDYVTDLTTGNQYKAIDYVILQSSLNKITIHHPNGESDIYNIISKERGDIQDMEYRAVLTGTEYLFQFDRKSNGNYSLISITQGGMWVNFHIVRWQNY